MEKFLHLILPFIALGIIVIGTFTSFYITIVGYVLFAVALVTNVVVAIKEGKYVYTVFFVIAVPVIFALSYYS